MFRAARSRERACTSRRVTPVRASCVSWVAVFQQHGLHGPMSFSEDFYLEYQGLLLPRETHCAESLKFAQEFSFKDDDVVAVTYPKS
ncbi:hypothetical protein GOODEAATRI_029896, partial [Goodea atripinnis]